MMTIPDRTCSKCGLVASATSEFFYVQHLPTRVRISSSCKVCLRTYQMGRYAVTHPVRRVVLGLVEVKRRRAVASAEAARLRRERLYVARGYPARALTPKPPKEHLGICRLRECVRCGHLLRPGAVNFANKANYCRPCGQSALVASNEAARAAAAVPERSCSVCGEVKLNTLGNFYRAASGVCKECWKARVRVYHHANPEAVKAKHSNRRARVLAAGGTFSATDVQRKLLLQKNTCYWCRAKLNGKYHVDHVIPLSRGGSNGPENIVCACAGCNLSKWAKMPWEFAGRLF